MAPTYRPENVVYDNGPCTTGRIGYNICAEGGGMIARATRNQIRKNLAKAHQKTVVQAQRTAQATLYAVLWSIIKGGAMAGEDKPDEFADAVMTFPRKDLDDIPANFGLVLKHSKETDMLSIHATLMKPKSPIILPERLNDAPQK